MLKSLAFLMGFLTLRRSRSLRPSAKVLAVPRYTIGQTVWLQWAYLRYCKHYVGEWDWKHPIKRELIVIALNPRVNEHGDTFAYIVRDIVGGEHLIWECDLVTTGDP